jgi:hypothetical protein
MEARDGHPLDPQEEGGRGGASARARAHWCVVAVARAVFVAVARAIFVAIASAVARAVAIFFFFISFVDCAVARAVATTIVVVVVGQPASGVSHDVDPVGADAAVASPASGGRRTRRAEGCSHNAADAGHR